MKNFAISFSFLFVLFLVACSDPLEGIGIKPEPVNDVNLTGEDGSLTVSWDKVYLADSYLVYYSSEQDIPAEPHMKITKTSITIPDLENDVIYYVWVVSSNKQGELTPQKVFFGTIPLSVPTEIILQIPKGDAIEVSWNSVVLAEEYEVFCKSSPIPPGVSDTPNQTVSGNSAILSGLDQSDYYIWVRAINNRGKSALSAMAQDIFIIGKPAEVTLYKTANDTIEASWDSVELASEYEIFCKTNTVPPSASDAPDHTVSTNSVVLSGLDQPDYYIWVRAKNSRGKSDLSAMAQDSFAVSGFKAAAVTTNSVSLEWNELKDASGYIIYRSASETGIYDRLNTAMITGTMFTDTGLDILTSYYYKISAVIGGGESLKSNPVSATTTVLPPPGNVRVSSVTSGRIGLAWDTVSGASGYNVYRSTSENGTYGKLNSQAVNGTVYTDTAISAFITYYYRICTVSSGGFESLQSGVVHAVYGTLVPGSGLAAKLSWLQSNATSNNLYGIDLSANESIGPHALSYSGRNNITITMRGIGSPRTVSLSSNGSLFTVHTGVTLILDNNITLSGRSDNNSSLVYIDNGGTMIVNTGAKITGNTSDSTGSGVRIVGGTFIMNGGEISGNISLRSRGQAAGIYISDGIFMMYEGKISGNTGNNMQYGAGILISGGIFTMRGGEISGNNYQLNQYRTSGGGVYVAGGIFRMSGGVIYGSNAASDLVNSPRALYKTGGTTQYGTFSGDTFYQSGDLDTANDTIRIVNGNLLTE